MRFSPLKHNVFGKHTNTIDWSLLVDTRHRLNICTSEHVIYRGRRDRKKGLVLLERRFCCTLCARHLSLSYHKRTQSLCSSFPDTTHLFVCAELTVRFKLCYLLLFGWCYEHHFELSLPFILEKLYPSFINIYIYIF